MGKVKYRTPSENFERITSKTESSKSRVSIGRENSIGEYYFLSVDSLVPYEKQARYIFDEAEINQLANTIKEHGINNPLLVIVSKTHKEKFEVVSGERRLRAAKLLKMEKVPCIIIEDEKAEEVALIENLQRADLHPVELGDALKSLLSEANWGSVSKLAEKLGKNQSTVSNYLSYSKLPDSIKEYLVKNNVKDREILRKILKKETVEEMEMLLGLRNSKKTCRQKSILRIIFDGENMNIQDRSLYKLDYDCQIKIKESLQNIINKIDKTSI